jgi:hypothetical protein
MKIFDFDLAGAFSFSMSPVELLLGGTLLHWYWPALHSAA